MRTSAAGRPERGCSPAKAGGQTFVDCWAPDCAGARLPTGSRGFTLVELLVVITMIALLSAVAVLAIPDPGGGLASEAERFAARAKAARDKAIVGARPVAITVGPAGYGFEQRDRGEWRPLQQKPFVDQRWNEGTAAAIAGTAPARVVFDSTGWTEPFQLTLTRGEERVLVEVRSAGIRVHR